MVVKSMTGYGRAIRSLNGREFTVEVRSVNNRYLAKVAIQQGDRS